MLRTSPSLVHVQTPGGPVDVTVVFDDETGKVVATEPNGRTHELTVTAEAPWSFSDLGAAIDAGVLYVLVGDRILLKRPATGEETTDQLLASAPNDDRHEEQPPGPQPQPEWSVVAEVQVMNGSRVVVKQRMAGRAEVKVEVVNSGGGVSTDLIAGL